MLIIVHTRQHVVIDGKWYHSFRGNGEDILACATSLLTFGADKANEKPGNSMNTEINAEERTN